MKRISVTFILLLCFVAMHAAGFNVGDAKYEILQDGTVMLKDYKKATGEVIIPERVRDPKKGTEYVVTKIGQEAFKKSAITKITLPESVMHIGKSAFEDCKSLTWAVLPKKLAELPLYGFYGASKFAGFDGCEEAETIKINAGSFANTAISGVLNIDPTITEIGPYAFSSTKVEGLMIVDSNLGLTISSTAFHDAPLNWVVLADRDVFFEKGFFRDGQTLVFMDENPGEKAWMIYDNMLTEKQKERRDLYFERRWYEDNDFYSHNFKKLWYHLTKNGQELYYVEPDQLPALPALQSYFGADVVDGQIKPKQETPLFVGEAITESYFNLERKRMIPMLDEFVRVAVEEPERLPQQYRNMDEKLVKRHHDLFTNAIRVLADSIYFVKPDMTKAEIENLGGFINNLFMEIGYDYGIGNLTLEKWARTDMLSHDIKNNAHKDDYDMVLKAIDRYFRVTNKKDNPYHMSMQLACLCGLERWKDAAAYFPKVYGAVTENGTWGVPSELVYMQNKINEHGFKAVKPTYGAAKSKKGGAKAKSGGGPNVELFTEALIGAAVDQYKEYRQRRAYKKWLNQIDKKFYKNARKGKFKR